MIAEYLPALANHLWQSTVFAGIAGLLVLVLRRNRASLRYAIWLIASVKFLIPFSLLVGVGNQFAWQAPMEIGPPLWIAAVDEIGYPFSYSEAEPVRVAPVSATETINLWPIVLLFVWLCGALLVACLWLREWQRMRALLKTASPLSLDGPVPVMASRARIEPGIVGVLRPVLLLPEGITERLTPAQLRSILVHELCHAHRRDNLTAALHMTVEMLFWFHPLVWWIEHRLLEERERACDEEVLRATAEPQSYAEGILNVCKFYKESSLVCRSGVAGSDLKKRIEAIMTPRALSTLGIAKISLLVAAAIAAVAAPILFGLVSVTVIQAQTLPVVAPPSPPVGVPAEVEQVAVNRPPALEPVAVPPTEPVAVPQEATATLRGKVVDANGGIVPSALLMLVRFVGDKTNGRAKMADPSGSFEFADLVPGEYAVQAGMTGYLKSPSRRFPLGANEVRNEDLTLTPGLQTGITVDSETTIENRMVLRFGTGEATRPVEVRKTQGALLYPASALEARVQGEFIVEGVLGADGKVFVSRVVSGAMKPQGQTAQMGLDLAEAATQAAKQLTFTPVSPAGIPVDFPVAIEVDFKLGDAEGAL